MASMLTTEDNPFDPRLDFQSWNAWDMDQGYNTCAYLARVTPSLPEGFPDDYIDFVSETAMNEIIEQHTDGLYKKLPILEAA